MPRTVVPSVKLRQAGGKRQTGGDSFPEKLVKYVPAETLAFFVPAAALLKDQGSILLILAVVVGLAGNLLYLARAAKKETDPTKKPRVHFYVLSGVTFLCWAVGTNAKVGELFWLNNITAGFVLMAAVFLIPVLDDLLDR